ncbi:ABC transporter ATP-binding protein [Streptomyces tardus]|uniref:ABC transporter ATP-binding protein n=1 Tax=Streptomyces tardus TaxID=2780544 RepID=UPI001C1F5ECE|nr:ABC transporter ATP-binding protein [Streptomyces tardus]
MLRDVDLDVEAGESVAITGPSGCGKSTLLLALAGIIRPDQGEIRIAGTNVRTADDDAICVMRRDAMGFVFQLGELIAELTLLENVAIPLELKGVRRHEARRRARSHMKELGIEELGNRFPGEVSGGQSQRAAVARALMNDPVVVLADEPTGALDGDNARRVLDQLLTMTAIRGTSLVMVTHDQNVAVAADRQIHMADGCVRSDGLAAKCL